MEQNNNDTLLQQLVAALNNHDFYYMYSDNFTVYKNGKRTKAAIDVACRNMVAAGRGDEAASIVQQYTKE